MIRGKIRLGIRNLFLGTTALLLVSSSAMGCGNSALEASNTVPNTAANIRGIITQVNTLEVTSGDRATVSSTPLDPTQTASSNDPQVGSGIPKDTIGTILIEENPKEQSGSDKVNVTIKQSTQILEQQGQQLSPAGFEAFSTGKQVKAWFNGPIAESYPAQATASVIVITEQ